MLENYPLTLQRAYVRLRDVSALSISFTLRGISDLETLAVVLLTVWRMEFVFVMHTSNLLCLNT